MRERVPSRARTTASTRLLHRARSRPRTLAIATSRGLERGNRAVGRQGSDHDTHTKDGLPSSRLRRQAVQAVRDLLLADIDLGHDRVHRDGVVLPPVNSSPDNARALQPFVIPTVNRR